MTSILSSLFAFSGVSSSPSVTGAKALDPMNQPSTNSSTNIFGEAFSLSLSDAGLGALGGDGSQSTGDTTDTLSALTYSGSTSHSHPKGGSGGSTFEALMASITTSSSSTDGGSDPLTATDPSTSSDTSDSSAAAGDLSQLMTFVQQIMANVDDSLESIGSTKPTTNSSTTAASQASATTNNPFASNSTDSAESALSGGGPLPAFIQQVDSQLHLDKSHQQALQNIANENMNANYTPDTVQKIAMELQQAGI